MSRWLLPVSALCAFAWAAARAALQSITIDEADTYLHYVDSVQPAHWFAAANNHLLNSALMRLATGLFGVSHFTVRLPALLAAALFLYAAVRLCRTLSGDWRVQWPLLVCLAFNPFTGDFLAAARGYGMALAFLLLALPPLARAGAPAPREIAASSAWLALSFTASFSFAIVDAMVLALVWWRGRGQRWTALATMLPAAAIVFLGPLWTLRRFPRSELWWGAASLGESLGSLYEATLYQPNPEIANRLMLAVLETLRPALLPAAALSAVALAAVLWRGRWRYTPLWGERRPRFAAQLTLAAGGAIATHYLAHLAFGLPLPKERTGLYAPALLTLAAGALAAVPPCSRVSRLLRGALLASMSALAMYFVFCLRLDHFKEWPWNSGGERLYAALACLNHNHTVRRVTSVWLYQSALNFYRIASGSDTLEPFAAPEENRPGTQAYVIHRLFDARLVGEKGLEIVYAAPEGDALVAVPRALAAPLRAGVCLH
jgi:hypothetical protein